MNDLMRRLLLLPPEGSTLAPAIDHLHFFVITVTMLGWLGVTLAALVFIIKFRRRTPVQTTPVVKTTVAFESTIVGALLGLFLLWWFIGYRDYTAIREPPDNAMVVYVTGKQWMWKFAYPNGRSAVSVLTVPAGRPVKLLMTSRDVIHSFFVPDFRLKQDVIPGRYTTLWFVARQPGTYQVLCAEYCGLLHSNMRASIVALSPADWARWLTETQPSVDATRSTTGLQANEETGKSTVAASRTGTDLDLAAQGREVAERFGCFGCHTTDGRPHIGPSWRGLYGSSVELKDGQHVLADESYLTESMMDPRKQVVRGFQPVMPSFQGLMKPAETAAIVELIKSLSTQGPKAVIPPWVGAAAMGPNGQPVAPTPPSAHGPKEPNGGPNQYVPSVLDERQAHEPERHVDFEEPPR